MEAELRRALTRLENKGPPRLRRAPAALFGEMTMVAATTPRGTSAAPAARPGVRKPWYKVLYIQVLTAIVLGAIIGWLFPEFAKNDWIRAMGDGFVKLIKMVIAPIIFCTVVSGIAHISEVRKVGRVAVKALVYFEIVSTFALALGLIVGNVLHPGAGFSGKADAGAVATYAKQASEMKSVDFVLHIIPDSVVGAFAQGEILQVLLFSVLFGFCADGARRQRRSSTHVCRRCRACDVRRNRTDRKSGANRRVWRNGLHDRPLRTAGSRQSRRLDRDLLSDGGRLCVPCIGNNRLVRRLLDLKISPVHQG